MSQRGVGKIRFLLATLVAAAVVLVAVRVVPVYVRGYQFEDAMRTAAKFARASTKTPEQVEAELFRKAQDLGVPLERQNLKVRPQGTGIQVSAKYSFTVDLVVRTIVIPWDYTIDTASAF